MSCTQNSPAPLSADRISEMRDCVKRGFRLTPAEGTDLLAEITRLRRELAEAAEIVQVLGRQLADALEYKADHEGEPKY